MKHLLLCGGSGSRLWPLSRETQPKQFIYLFDRYSLFQKTFLGNRDFVSETIIVCNIDHQILAQKQLKEFKETPIRFVFEPIGRNTSAAIALALNGIDLDEIVLVTPSDHQIEYSELYLQAIRRAEELARNGNIVVFGIVPNAPETGYGYMEANGEIVTQFHEKPDLETALQYLTSGRFFWNSGMLCFKVRSFLEKLKKYAPEVLEFSKLAYQKASANVSKKNEIKIALEDIEKIPSLSIDYALLEKMKGLRMIRCEFRWSDLGSFDSLFFQLQKDEFGNALDVKSFYGVNAKNNLIISDQRIISAVDVEDLVIVDTKDALLISKLGSTQKVREIVNQLKLSATLAHKAHIEEIRSWGNFTILDISEMHSVKRIIVFPGEKFSFQSNRNCQAHWVIVSGSARVLGSDQENILKVNQAVYIPAEELRCIENIGIGDLIFIQVQYGDYKGEDGALGIEHEFENLVKTEK